MQQQKKLLDHIIVVHNFCHVTTKAELENMTKRCLEECFMVEKKEHIWVAKSKSTYWRNKDGLMRHVILAKEGSEAGRITNDLTIKLLQNWISALSIERQGNSNPISVFE